MTRLPRTVLSVLMILTAACSRVAAAPLAELSGSAGMGSAAGGSVLQESFFSEALGVRKALVVYLPPSYSRKTARRYPVAYYLHGLSGAQADWVSKGGIDAVADSLYANGTPEMILVMPDGDDGWYTTWVRQFSYRTCTDTLKVEAPDRYCVEHERYDDYVAHDVVRFIDSRYRTIADREHRAIAGLSMGGYGALMLALHFPDVFSAAASHSGVVSPTYVGPHPFVEPARFATTVAELQPAAGGFWQRYLNYWGTEMPRWDEADPAHAAALVKQRRAPMPALFFDCGIDDPFIDQNRALHSELTRLGIEHRFAEWPGAHTWRYWNAHVRESLAWVGMRIGR